MNENYFTIQPDNEKDILHPDIYGEGGLALQEIIGIPSETELRTYNFIGWGNRNKTNNTDGSNKGRAGESVNIDDLNQRRAAGVEREVKGNWLGRFLGLVPSEREQAERREAAHNDWLSKWGPDGSEQPTIPASRDTLIIPDLEGKQVLVGKPGSAMLESKQLSNTDIINLRLARQNDDKDWEDQILRDVAGRRK